MRLLLVVVFAVALIAAAVVAQAPDVSGTWEITVYASQGPVPATLVLKQEGEKLTGVIRGGEGGEMPLEGSVKGNELGFGFMYGDIPVSMSGKVEGDAIKVVFDASGQDGGEWSGKRATKPGGH